jgi:hypothetical protein
MKNGGPLPRFNDEDSCVRRQTGAESFNKKLVRIAAAAQAIRQGWSSIFRIYAKGNDEFVYHRDRPVGIYNLDGDTLTICWNRTDQSNPPTDFTCHKGSDRRLTRIIR